MIQTIPVQHFAVINRSSLPDLSVQLMIAGYRQELPKLCAAWGVPVPGLALYENPAARPNEAACIFFVDEDGDADTFGAHTKIGANVFGYVDVAGALLDLEPVDRVFGHELFEATVNPGLARWSLPLSDGSRVSMEVCDPVQRLSYAMTAEWLGKSGIVNVANWVSPYWFDEDARGGPFDAMGVLERPLSDADGGYHLVSRGAVTSITGPAGFRVIGHGRAARILTRLV